MKRKDIARKILSTITALTLAFSVSATVFADTDITPDSSSSTGETAVSYTTGAAYTVTIPASVTIGNSATVSASNVVVDEGKTLQVAITGTSGEDNAFTIASSSGGDTLTYTVKSGATEYSLNDVVLTVDPAEGTEGSVDLAFALAEGEDPRYSGTYSGTITFTVSVR